MGSGDEEGFALSDGVGFDVAVGVVKICVGEGEGVGGGVGVGEIIAPFMRAA